MRYIYIYLNEHLEKFREDFRGIISKYNSIKNNSDLIVLIKLKNVKKLQFSIIGRNLI